MKRPGSNSPPLNLTDIDSMKKYVEDNASGINGLSISVKMFFRLMKDNRH